MTSYSGAPCFFPENIFNVSVADSPEVFYFKYQADLPFLTTVKLQYLLSFPFHCLNFRFLIASLSSLNQNSFDNGGLIYGKLSSSATTKI